MTQFFGELLAGAIRYFLYIFEALAVLTLLRVALRNPSFGGEWLQRMEAGFRRFANRRGRAVVTVGLLALGIRAALLPILPPRLPGIADEFSYVLSGETFAMDRVTNPPHPMWTYFESPQVLQQPTYMSMYFPAQGLFMAAGKVVGGSLWAGVWLSAGLMCAAICWMLQGWLPPAWAFLGGLLAVMRLGLFGYWMNSFYGGALPALGGALVLGALPRIMRNQRVLDSTLLAIGLAILANSRPFEGLLLALPVAGALAFWMFGKTRPPIAVTVTHVLAPAFLILVVAAAATCYYYWRVTGSPFRMPQALQRDTYAVAPYFMWQSPKPEPVYRNAGMRAFHTGAEMEYFRRTRSISGWAETSLEKVRDFWLFYLGPILTLPLLALPWTLRDRKMRFLVITGAIVFLGLAANNWFYPHYAAPATALLYALLIQSIRHLRLWKWHGARAGVVLARGIPVLCALMVIVRIGAQPLSSYMPLDFPMTWFSTRPGGVYRADILRQLHGEGGRHLILVRWRPGDNPFEQWVFNDPDIDRSAVVWAWETDKPEDLLRYYKDRRVWLLRPAWQGPPALSPYPGTIAP